VTLNSKLTRVRNIFDIFICAKTNLGAEDCCTDMDVCTAVIGAHSGQLKREEISVLFDIVTFRG